MKGLFIRDQRQAIETVSKRTEVLSLLGSGDGVEVMLQTIRKGENFSVSPGENEELMEFFYILQGSAEELGNKTTLGRDCYFYVHGLEDTVFFKATEELVMLYVSTQPVFSLLSDEILELTRISKLVEEKDMYTYEHNNRLRDYAIKIGERMNLSEERLKVLYYAALFHDIGKINVPDEVLNKPGRLTKEEFEYIKKHPSDGKAILLNSHMKDSAEAIEQHHERLDGTGYPKGLKGDEILIEARIIAVVDSFDAMVSTRPYKEGMSIDVVMDELMSLRGTYYEKAIVNHLEQILIEENKLKKV